MELLPYIETAWLLFFDRASFLWLLGINRPGSKQPTIRAPPPDFWTHSASLPIELLKEDALVQGILLKKNFLIYLCIKVFVLLSCRDTTIICFSVPSNLVSWSCCFLWNIKLCQMFLHWSFTDDRFIRGRCIKVLKFNIFFIQIHSNSCNKNRVCLKTSQKVGIGTINTSTKGMYNCIYMQYTRFTTSQLGRKQDN